MFTLFPGHFPKGDNQPAGVSIRPPKQEQYPPVDITLFSILVAIFCCAPLGVLSLFFNIRARNAVMMNDPSTAISNAAWAKRLAIWGLGIGIGLTVLIVGIIAVLASTRCEKSSWSCVELVFSPDE